MTVTITVHAEKAIQKLTDMQARLADFTPVLERAERNIQDAVSLNFATEGSLVGGWAPLSPRYAAYKIAHEGAEPLLVRTGALAVAMGHLPFEIGTHELTVRLPNSPDYLGFHERGTYKMPARRLMVTPPDFAAYMRTAVADYIMEGDGAAAVTTLIGFIR